MSEETTTTEATVTVSLSKESAYAQLVSFQQGVVDYNKAQDEDDESGMLAAANNVIEGFVAFVNDFMPPEVSDELHERLEKEHPDLLPEEDPMLAMLRELLSGGAVVSLGDTGDEYDADPAGE